MLNIFLFIAEDAGDQIDSRDTATFRNMMLVVVVVGGASSLVFCLLVQETDEPRNDVITKL